MEIIAQIFSTTFLFFALNIISLLCGVIGVIRDYGYNTSKAMREYQQKHMIRTLVYSRFSIVVLFILIILLLRSIMELNDKRIEVGALRDESVKEKTLLQEKVDKSKAQNEAIATPRGFEAYVRSTYPVVKEGEGVIVVYEEGKSPVSEVRKTMTIWERFIIFWQSLGK